MNTDQIARDAEQLATHALRAYAITEADWMSLTSLARMDRRAERYHKIIGDAISVGTIKVVLQ